MGTTSYAFQAFINGGFNWDNESNLLYRKWLFKKTSILSWLLGVAGTNLSVWGRWIIVQVFCVSGES